MTFEPLPRISMVLLLLVVGLSLTHAKLRRIRPGCRYEGRRYAEGSTVSTAEACLQCRCVEGALRCRLRICPRLPNTPPPGCRFLQPEENACCARLTCASQSHPQENASRTVNAASDATKGNENSYFRSSLPLEGCVDEGVRYAPGSAMKGSRRCEYCYCISGRKRCIRPKCLLPLPGCIALYAPYSCCPVAYNCTHSDTPTSVPTFAANGCRIGDRSYIEGEMVRDIAWKAPCDNCFCAMGTIRCVPLSCAPPLQGCSPIVREGQCCPSTYNCSGSIEVKAIQDYASFAFISKDYAKFRKETNFFATMEHTTSLSSVEGRGHRVVDERIDNDATVVPAEEEDDDDDEEELSVSRHSTTWRSTFETEIMDNEILMETVGYTKATLQATSSTTFVSDDDGDEEKEKEEEEEEEEEGEVEETIAAAATTTTTAVPTATATDSWTTSYVDGETTLGEFERDSISSTEETTLLGSSVADENDDVATSTTAAVAKTKAQVAPAAVGQVAPEPTAEVNPTRTESTGKKEETSSSPSSTVLMPDDVFVMNVTVKTNVSVGHIQGVTINPIRSIPPDVEAILNISHREKEDDYDYDYSEPTLPPSLPNVRIIPFVAADALVKDKDVASSVTGYPPGSAVMPPELRPTDTSGFYDIATQENRFSPPVETEGGFVPREPPYFDGPYRSTALNLEIGTGVTVAAARITGLHRKTDGQGTNCLFESREYRHGDVLPKSEMCVICMCYYGEVVCSSEKCPPLKIGCRSVTVADECCGKIICVDAQESPTVVLDRADATASSQRQTIAPLDPFRDVIKTEPAPDLPSLIEDMLPYLVERGLHGSTATPGATSPMTTPSAVKHQPGNHVKHAENLDYGDKISILRPPFDYRQKIVSPLFATEGSRPTDGDASTSPMFKDAYKSKDQHEATQISMGGDSSLIGDNISFKLIYASESAKQSNAANVTSSATKFSIDSSSPSSATSNDKPDLENDNDDDDDDDDDDDNVFSLDGVFHLFFSSAHSSTVKTESASTVTSLIATVPSNSQNYNNSIARNATTTSTTTTKVASLNASTTNRSNNSEEEKMMNGSTKIVDDEIGVQGSVSGLLRLAGCNIYGRMYRVGRIITELSSPCLQCRCTEIGVQCKQLNC